MVFVELPESARPCKGGEAAVVESVKAATRFYAPVSGEVVEVNSDLEGSAATVNDDPFGKGWFAKLKIKNLAEVERPHDRRPIRGIPEDHRLT